MRVQTERFPYLSTRTPLKRVAGVHLQSRLLVRSGCPSVRTTLRGSQWQELWHSWEGHAAGLLVPVQVLVLVPVQVLVLMAVVPSCR